jgi:3-oxoacyl-[acyl-carrier-protein] synthase II
MRRVVITGLGAITPVGNNIKDFWSNLIAGKSGGAPITRFDSAKHKTQFACELKGYKAEDHFDRKELRKLDPFCQYALLAVDEAMANSGLDINTIDQYRAGVIWGSGYGGLSTMQEAIFDYVEHDFVPRFTPFTIPRVIINIAAGLIAIKYGFKGVNYAPTAACASSNIALVDALNQVRWGRADLIIAGGSEATVLESSMGGFNSLQALSVRNNDPATASRPFDPTRDGFVMGEGAGALIIEELEHAKRRGAHIYAELTGGAITSDAYHITASHPDGEGSTNSMKMAMVDANVKPTQVDHINAHATSTPLGDVSETKAILNVFGDHATKINISATKSMTGHLLGGAGAVEAIACVLAIRDSIVPPTINTQTIDPGIPNLNYTLGKAQKREVKVALNNTFGFGGHNVTTVFSKFEA